MLHVLLIPDGVRRFARKNNLPLTKAYEIAAKKLAKLIKLSLTRESPITELSVYPLAAYNLNRNITDVIGLKYGFGKFITLLTEDSSNYSIRVFGNRKVLQKLSNEYYIKLTRITKENGMQKRLNLLLAYDSLESCPEYLDPKNWKPFCLPIKIIYRYAQPRYLVRGSGIFPMSEQAYWASTTELFPDTNFNKFIHRIDRIIKQIK